MGGTGLMDTREYIQERIGVYTRSIDMAQRSKDGNTYNKDHWDSRIERMIFLGLPQRETRPEVTLACHDLPSAIARDNKS